MAAADAADRCTHRRRDCEGMVIPLDKITDADLDSAPLGSFIRNTKTYVRITKYDYGWAYDDAERDTVFDSFSTEQLYDGDELYLAAS